MTIPVYPNQSGSNTPSTILTAQGAGNSPIYRPMSQIANDGIVVSTTATTFTSTTTLGALTGLGVALQSSSTYAIQGFIPMTTNATAGAALSLSTSDTLTATSVDYAIQMCSATASAVVNSTALDSTASTALNLVSAYIEGTIVTNAAGTLIVKGAQVSSTSGATSFLINGWLQVARVS